MYPQQDGDVLEQSAGRMARDKRRLETSSYIADLLREMVPMANAAGRPMLAYLIDMARLEAEAAPRSIKAPTLP